MALSALIIKARFGLTDEELVEQINGESLTLGLHWLEGLSACGAVLSIDDGLFPMVVARGC